MDRFVNDAIKRGKAMLAAEPSMKSDNVADMEILWGPEMVVYDEIWTREQEMAFLVNWNSCDLAADFKDMTDSNLASLASLWKMSCAVMRCSPVSIISQSHGLRYKPIDSNLADGMASPVWPRSFCEALLVLICHPIWRRNAAMLTVALQFIVLCRDGERDPCDMPVVQGNADFAWLRETASKNRDCNLHRMCSERKAVMLNNGESISMEFNFFCHLGSLVGQETRRQDGGTNPILRYRLHGAGDLKILTNALDTFMNDGITPLFPSCELNHAIMKKCINRTDIPSRTETKEFHTRSWIHERRLALRKHFAKHNASLERSESEHGTATTSSDGFFEPSPVPPRGYTAYFGPSHESDSESPQPFNDEGGFATQVDDEEPPLEAQQHATAESSTQTDSQALVPLIQSLSRPPAPSADRTVVVSKEQVPGEVIMLSQGPLKPCQPRHEPIRETYYPRGPGDRWAH